jgi:uncharacterized protein
MAVASFRFYAELNDFLSTQKREVSIEHSFTERASIKDMIEALGVPHPEVDCIEVNGIYVDFSYIVQNGDTISVYPISAKGSTVSNISTRPQLPTVIRFVLDIHLGKLATYLRLLGFDTLYRNDYADEELAQISSTQERILLTRDCGLLMRRIVLHGYYVRNTDPQQQIVEVMQRFNLYQLVSPFQRCLRCNGLLEPVPKEAIVDQLPESIRLYVNEFYRCQNCKQVYWKGSHYEKLQQFIDSVIHNR